MTEYATEYANAADDGAPYVGPVVLAASFAEAEAITAARLRGPNGEPLRVIGEIVARLQASVHGDTKTWLRRGD
jgi:hypothetical protein